MTNRDVLVSALAEYRANPINAHDRPQSWRALDALLEACDGLIAAEPAGGLDHDVRGHYPYHEYDHPTDHVHRAAEPAGLDVERLGSPPSTVDGTGMIAHRGVVSYDADEHWLIEEDDSGASRIIARNVSEETAVAIMVLWNMTRTRRVSPDNRLEKVDD